VFKHRNCKLFIFNDITEVRLKKQIEEAEGNNQYLRALNLHVSHQIITPITETITMLHKVCCNPELPTKLRKNILDSIVA
jgi:hypothetical protein